MMSRLLLVLALFFVVAGLIVVRSDPRDGSGRESSLVALFAATRMFFESLADLSHSFHERLWAVIPIGFRWILGALKCLEVLLLIWGGMSLRLIARVGHHIL